MKNKSFWVYALLAGLTPLLVLWSSLSRKTVAQCVESHPLVKSVLDISLMLPTKVLTTVVSDPLLHKQSTPLGMAQIVSKNGKPFLQLDVAFQDNGDDDQLSKLQVLLDTAMMPPENYVNPHRYLNLGLLKEPCGTQQYPIPEQVDISRFRSVAIWHYEQNRTLGFALLEG